jgi:WD40 repeat protein
MSKADDDQKIQTGTRRKRERPEVYRIKHSDARKPGRREFLTGTLATAGLLVSAADRSVNATDEKTRLAKKLKCSGAYAHGAEISGVAISPDGKTLFSSGYDTMVKVWSFPDGRLLSTLEGHREPILCMALSPNGKRLLTSDDSGEVRLWRIKKKRPERSKLKKVLDQHSDPVEAVAVSPDNKFAVSADRFGTFVVWSLPGGRKITTWKSENRVNGIAISPDGKILASVGYDKKLDIWSLKDNNLGTLIRSIDIGEWNDAVLFSPDGSRIVTRYWLDFRIRIWRTKDWKQEKCLTFDDYDVEALAFNPDGSLLAGGQEEIKIWSFPSMKTKASFSQGDGHAGVMTFSPDGEVLVTGNWASSTTLKYGQEGQIKIWDHSKKKRAQVRCMIDLEATPKNRSVPQYSYRDAKGRKVTVTLPNCKCAPQLPEDAKCVCDTVEGSFCGCDKDVGGCTVYTHYWHPN